MDNQTQYSEVPWIMPEFTFKDKTSPGMEHFWPEGHRVTRKAPNSQRVPDSRTATGGKEII